MKKQPFHIDVTEEILDDLQERLARTRWADEPAGAGWSYGMNPDYLRRLVEYWRQDYDWRTQALWAKGYPETAPFVKAPEAYVAFLRSAIVELGKSAGL